MGAHFTTRVEGPSVEVVFTDEALDGGNIDDVGESLDALVRQSGGKLLTLDFGRVVRVDGPALSRLVSVYLLAKRVDCGIRLLNLECKIGVNGHGWDGRVAGT